ncbi:MAG: hypothetical protein IJD81_07330 [Oscillospiraceae bacterium]|nr:hypothetical protein [Oscillospiraceae bacterium]
MKLHNRPLFLVGLVCGLGAIHAWKNLDGNQGIIWIAFFLYLMARCLLVSFANPKENNEKQKS